MRKPRSLARPRPSHPRLRPPSTISHHAITTRPITPHPDSPASAELFETHNSPSLAPDWRVSAFLDSPSPHNHPPWRPRRIRSPPPRPSTTARPSRITAGAPRCLCPSLSTSPPRARRAPSTWPPSHSPPFQVRIGLFQAAGFPRNAPLPALARRRCVCCFLFLRDTRPATRLTARLQTSCLSISCVPHGKCPARPHSRKGRRPETRQCQVTPAAAALIMPRASHRETQSPLGTLTLHSALQQPRASPCPCPYHAAPPRPSAAAAAGPAPACTPPADDRARPQQRRCGTHA